MTEAKEEASEQPLSVRLLEDCRTAFGTTPALPTEDLLSRLKEDPESPWPTWGGRIDGLTAMKLGVMLRDYYIRFARISVSALGQIRGYRRVSETEGRGLTKRTRANGEGSIFPYRTGYAAYVWVTTPAGLRRRKYVYGKTREIVHEKWVKLMGQARQGPVATTSQTVEQYLTYWLREVIQPNRAPLTHAAYETMCRLHIIPGLGKKRLDRLTVRDVQTWLTRVRPTCQCCAQGKDANRPEAKRRCCAVGQCCNSVLAPRTIRDLKTILRSALSNAITEELITKNVAALTKVPSKRTRKAQAWTSEEARTFLESARQDGDPLYAAYVLVLVLGLRKGEMLGLGWDQIDLTGGSLFIEWQVQRVRRQLLRRETKTEASDAGLPLPDICVTGSSQLRVWSGDRVAVPG